ncbi:hypothetical protein VCHA43P277_40111 [Vibrio chagasii]|nr:hypothetical protein VCHA35O141_30062 [Vibrio chagasii]CAH6954904.1 hypothetical protein VCHA35O143_30179 [Vibrio chagasii]CAH6988802.1 hypothetical protein VCHA31O73_40064 [Vibrio chagasii]CAH7002597.1 hypothetical protein VCHA34P126_50112 [Vibrio chagasii]CAH7161298.1 hypothetical protein VCHA38P215_20174 [Vibrio chagasii]
MCNIHLISSHGLPIKGFEVFVRRYNTERKHGKLNYVSLSECHDGKREEIRAMFRDSRRKTVKTRSVVWWHHEQWGRLQATFI